MKKVKEFKTVGILLHEGELAGIISIWESKIGKNGYTQILEVRIWKGCLASWEIIETKCTGGGFNHFQQNMENIFEKQGFYTIYKGSCERFFESFGYKYYQI